MKKVCTQCQREYTSPDVAQCESDGTDLLPVLCEYEPEEKALVGRVLGGRYVIDKLLGVGGMGIVVRARHVFLDRLVAVKLLHPELLVVKEVKDRVLREARTASALRDHHVVEISDFGVTAEGLHYLVMEFLEGCDLHDFGTAKSLVELDLTLQIGVQVCKALEVIHAQGIVHRDLKPENIWMVAGDGLHVKVLDFGIAGIMADDEGEKVRLTKTGKTVGTPHYMAPEQGRGTKIDGRADVYALGCILYEMVTGQPAFEGNSALDILMAHLMKQAQAPSSVRSELPIWFDELILRCLHKNPDDRFQTATELRIELERGLGLTTAGLDRIPKSARPTTETAAEVTQILDGVPAVGEADTVTAAPPVSRSLNLRPTMTVPPTAGLDVVEYRRSGNKTAFFAGIAAALAAVLVFVLWPSKEPPAEKAPAAAAPAPPIAAPAPSAAPDTAAVVEAAAKHDVERADRVLPEPTADTAAEEEKRAAEKTDRAPQPAVSVAAPVQRRVAEVEVDMYQRKGIDFAAVTATPEPKPRAKPKTKASRRVKKKDTGAVGGKAKPKTKPKHDTNILMKPE